jgi:hypothetical protein
MLGREVEGGQQCFAILGQAFDRLVVFRLVFLSEDKRERSAPKRTAT